MNLSSLSVYNVLVLIILGQTSNYLLFVRALNDGRDLILNASEKEALDKFKLEVTGSSLPEDFMRHDSYLINWLRVSNMNVGQATERLLKSVRWRKSNNISSILSKDWSDMHEDFPISFEGHDKQGRPIMTLDLADWDLRSAAIQGRIGRVREYLAYAGERAWRNILEEQKKGKKITREVILMDADGFSLVLHGCIQCLGALSYWAYLGEAYYPRMNDEIIMINAPNAAVISLNAIRPVLTSETRRTFKVFGTNKRLWMSYLDQRIDKKERSVRYGGYL